MNKEELQQKIAEYYQKLSPESQKVFSEMKWLETLKEISLKFNLTDEQIETLGTETMLILLGLIHLDEYQNNLKEELRLERTDQIFAEIKEKVLKNINEELENTFYNNNQVEQELDERFENLSEKTKDAIKKSNYQTKIYNIGKKYGLTVYQIGVFGETVINVILGKIPPTKFEDSLSILKLEKDTTTKLVNEINEEILKKIREELIIGTTQKEDKEEEYESREELLKTIEKPELISNYELKITNEKKEVVQPEKKEEEQIIKKEITPPVDLAKQKELGDGKDMHPILAQKLSSVFKMERKETEHSIGNITKSEKETVSEKPKVDPYRELPV